MTPSDLPSALTIGLQLPLPDEPELSRPRRRISPVLIGNPAFHRLERRDRGLVPHLFARGSWPRAVGLSCALFHRTWSGNLYLDFLLSNPRAAVGHERVHGSSFWVLLRLCELADALGARFISGETTELSCGFYRKAFGVRARDLLLLTAQKRKNFVTFLDGEVRPRLNALPEEHGR